MKPTISLLFISFLVIIFASNGFSQKPNQAKIDSINKALGGSIHDSVKAKLLGDLYQVYIYSDRDKAFDYAKQALDLSLKIHFKKGIRKSYNNLGHACQQKSEYNDALDYLQKAKKACEEDGDKYLLGGVLNNIAVIYKTWGNYPESLKYYLMSLKVNEQTGNKDWQANNLMNIGTIQLSLHNYPEALKAVTAALKIKEELGDKRSIANGYIHLGNIFLQQKQYPEAMKNYNTALKIAEDIGSNFVACVCYSNLGTIYKQQGNYVESMKYTLMAGKIAEETNDKERRANNYLNLGELYTLMKKYPEARDYLKKGLALSEKLHLAGKIPEAYQLFSRLDSAQGKFRQALENYKLYIVYHDSLNSEENRKKLIQTQMQYDFDKNQELAKAEQNKKDELARKELQRQKLVRNGFIGGFLVVVIFAFVFFRQRNRIKGEKKTSEEARKVAEAEKEKSEELLLNILPAEVADEIKRDGHSKARTFSMVTVMFTDFKDFSAVSEKVSAELLVAEIDHCFSAFDNIIQRHHVEKIKTVGDAYICVGGMPALTLTHATDILNAAIEIRDFMVDRKKQQDAIGGISFELRLGIHTGPVVAGIVGVKKYAYDIWGDTVNIAARMEQNSEAGKINISGSTYELVKTKYTCVHRGKIEAKNKGMIDMYFVEK